MSSSEHPGGRGHITSAARQRGARAKAERGVFNRYIRALKGRHAQRTRARLAEVEATLARGSRMKKAPVFEGGKRVGTVEKALPLLPSEHATLLVQRDTLREALINIAPDALREAFLEVLPGYAKRSGFTRAILLEVGVPSRDLDEAGILD